MKLLDPHTTPDISFKKNWSLSFASYVLAACFEEDGASLFPSGGNSSIATEDEVQTKRLAVGHLFGRQKTKELPLEEDAAK